MSLFIKKGVDGGRPEGAIELRKDQVAGFYDILVQTWKPQSEIWALTYGPKILGAAGSLSAIYGTIYFRRKLRLRHYGQFSTYLPNTILPFLIVQSFHQMSVTNDIYMNPLGCSLCKETRAAMIQVGFGLLQPLLLVPASSFMFATRHFTYRLPSPIHNTKDFLRVCKQLYRPLKVPMTINVALQIMIAIFITHMEENHFFIYKMQSFNRKNTIVLTVKSLRIIRWN